MCFLCQGTSADVAAVVRPPLWCAPVGRRPPPKRPPEALGSSPKTKLLMLRHKSELRSWLSSCVRTLSAKGHPCDWVPIESTLCSWDLRCNVRRPDYGPSQMQFAWRCLSGVQLCCVAALSAGGRPAAAPPPLTAHGSAALPDGGEGGTAPLAALTPFAVAVSAQLALTFCFRAGAGAAARWRRGRASSWAWPPPPLAPPTTTCAPTTAASSGTASRSAPPPPSRTARPACNEGACPCRTTVWIVLLLGHCRFPGQWL